MSDQVELMVVGDVGAYIHARAERDEPCLLGSRVKRGCVESLQDIVVEEEERPC